MSIYLVSDESNQTFQRFTLTTTTSRRSHPDISASIIFFTTGDCKDLREYTKISSTEFEDCRFRRGCERGKDEGETMLVDALLVDRFPPPTPIDIPETPVVDMVF